MTFNPYAILGLDRSATDKEIKSAYKEKSLQHHPDIGGDDDMFANCTAAKNLLLDRERRRAYDRGGWELVKRFDEMKREQEHRDMPKCDNFHIGHQITLRQLYNKEKLKLQASIPQYDDSGACPDKEFDLELQVQPEMLHRPLMIQDQGINKPDHLPGDIIVNIELAGDLTLSEFKIEGKHLIAEVPLKLAEVIQGYNVEIRHPDGNTYIITGQYTENEEDNVRVFPDMGLPYSGRRGDEVGDLIVKPVFDIKSLLELSPETKKALLKLTQKHAELHSDPPAASGVNITENGKTLDDMRQQTQQGMMGNNLHQMMGMMGGNVSMEGGQQCGVQ